MNRFLFILVILFSSQLHAQDYLAKFGKPDLNEIVLKEYSKDKNADAVVLFDMGTSYFVGGDNGFDVYFEKTTRIKIFKKSAFQWAEVEIPFYFEGDIAEQVYDIEAYAYNIENSQVKISRLDTKNTFEEKKNQSWRIKKFAIPDVKEGTVIEYRYFIKSPYLFNLRGWEFQSSIPTVYSEYVTKMNPFYEYTFMLTGRNKLDIYESHEDGGIENHFGSVVYHDMVYKFGLKDVPAFNDESYISSRNDYIVKIDFQLSKIHNPSGYAREIISTWPNLNNELLKSGDFGKFINNAEKSAKDAINLSELADKDAMKRLEYLVNYTKSHFSWDGQNFLYTHKSVKDFLKGKTGSNAEINLYLLGLLRSAGMDASPVIISTRSHGKVHNDYPFLSFFNYVIVIVNIDGKSILVDGTEPLCPFNKIPPRCINETGLIVKKDGNDWVKLNSPDKSFIEKKITLQFNDNLDSLKAGISASYSNYEAFDCKKDLENNPDKIKESLLKKGYSKIDSLRTENFDDALKNYAIRYSTSLVSEKLENKIYISPFLYEGISENPLKQVSRQYDLDFIYPYGRAYKTVIKIPKGYKVQFLPEPLNVNTSLGTISYQTNTQEDNSLVVSATYMFNKGLFTSEEYPKVRYLLNQVIEKFNEKVVFEKSL